MTHVASADAGFWLCRRDTIAASQMVGRPGRDQEFRRHCYDPDAPTGSGFWHWLVVNIPANVTELSLGAGSKGGAMPPGFAADPHRLRLCRYGGPCPPEGRPPAPLLFTVFAGRRRKPAGESRYARSADRFNLHFNTLAKAAIMGLFKR